MSSIDLSKLTQQVDDIDARVRRIQHVLAVSQLWTMIRVIAFLAIIFGGVVFVRPLIAKWQEFAAQFSQVQNSAERPSP